MTMQTVDTTFNDILQNNYMQQLDRQLNENHLLKHPFYQAWSAGKLSLNNLCDYACQYYHHVNVFPRYISATHSHCQDPTARKVLLDNLNDEEGMNGLDSHPVLWLQFTQGLGLADETVTGSALFPEKKQFIDEFMALSRSSYAEGLGALYAYERQIPQTAASKITGLKQFYNISDETTLKFFLVHREADVEHSEATKTLIKKLSTKEKIIAEKAAKKIAQSIWNMLSGIQSRTMTTLCEATIV